ncbi:oxidative damage protection protein [Buchnera aphidicola]|uniref:Probable Fe(2+)-trafficking protein n=1 Tax=Buchnera aphidicola subsp. Melaphis rhois TaxID=118103 RepID=A0A4D6YCY3_BUCMH|nr:oxidative damage protection protein [Buchnera aphidicola]QCI23510.1 oxidative damage protection protein [Buchnera aphidicola (Melaphis rhois)]
MNRKIFCLFLKKHATGLDKQPYPGKIGKKIYNNVSEIAWKKWVFEQTKIINEKKLNMLNIHDRKILENCMINFFFNKNNISKKI